PNVPRDSKAIRARFVWPMDHSVSFATEEGERVGLSLCLEGRPRRSSCPTKKCTSRAWRAATGDKCPGVRQGGAHSRRLKGRCAPGHSSIQVSADGDPW